MGKPDGIFDFQANRLRDVMLLKMKVSMGLSELTNAHLLPPWIFEVCAGCQLDAIVSPSLAPVASNLAPIVPTPTLPACFAIPSNGCAVHGSDFCVENPDGIIDIPVQLLVTCGHLKDAGLDGSVPPDVC